MPALSKFHSSSTGIGVQLSFALLASMILIAAATADENGFEHRSDGPADVYFSSDNKLRNVESNLSPNQIRAHNYLYGRGLAQDIDRAVQIDYQYVGFALLDHSRRLITDEDSPRQALSNLIYVRSIAVNHSDVELETRALWYTAFAHVWSERYVEGLEISRGLIAEKRFPHVNRVFLYLQHLKAARATESFEDLLKTYEIYFRNLRELSELDGFVPNHDHFDISLGLLTEQTRYHERILSFLQQSAPSLPNGMASVVYEAIADVYNVRDKHRQAFQFYEKALVGVSEVRASDLKIKMYSTGYLASATDLVISEQDVSGSDRIRKLLNIYNYEFDEDDIESSRPLLNTLIEATEISIKDGEPSLDYLIFIEHLAKFRALETSDPETQFKVYEEAFKRLGLDLYETPNSDVPHELLLKYRELTYWYEGNFHAAIDVAEELLRRDSELFGQDSRWLIDNLWRLSIYYWATDQKDAFKSTVNRALNIQLSTLDNGMCPPLFPIYADETISVFSDDELRTYMSRFTQALSQLGGKYAGLEEKFGCQKHVREKAILNIRLLNDDIGNAEDTFQLAQLLRLTQYTFSTNLGVSKAAISNPETLDLINRFNQLSVELDESLSRTNERYRSNTTNYLSTAKEREQIAEQILEKQPNLQPALSANPASADEIANLLGDHEAFVYYSRLINDIVYAWVITGKMTQLIVIPKNIEESKSLVGQIRETLEQSGVSSFTEVRPFDIKSSNELFETYFQPVERFLPNVTRIYLVPPDELGPIPFEIFSRSTTKDAINSFIDFNKYTDIEWLNDSYEFIYVPSANSFVSNFKRPGVRNHRYLGIGDPTAHSASEQASTSEVYSDLVLQGYTARSPVDSLPRLPNARRQLEVLGQAFDKNPRIVSGSRATEATVRKELNDPYSIIAFATHALLGDSQDEPPYLVLSSSDEAGPQDDGLLTTFEIAELDVRANLIVLSACNTATPGNTRGLNNLTSSFMHAGASTVVASHWSVEERATTELLSEMARQLGDGETASISSALKAARSSVLRDSRNYAYSHPMFWGAFTVRGVANDTFLSTE